MINTLKKLFGMGPKVDLAQLIKEGAIIVDVRSKAEYAGGHVKGSINIPLDQLGSNLAKLKKDKAIITCCASGMRSGVAKSQLKGKGYENVHNGGSWMNVNSYK
ncbi:MAG: rhodanese-like domain-containing protein [Bacteroidetes bacterium]|jgi:rhodanese-related sulfurtransferase|nr:rhodanese-like domain-containing protein [Bacteroidota bacterium]